MPSTDTPLARYPVLSWPRDKYVMPGTDIGRFGPSWADFSRGCFPLTPPTGSGLRSCYALSGTEQGCSMRCPVLSQCPYASDVPCPVLTAAKLLDGCPAYALCGVRY
eukprot:3841289-Rhodomonas_salina.1